MRARVCASVSPLTRESHYECTTCEWTSLVDGVATKGHRAGKFAEWLMATFGKEALTRGTGVLDVAGGRGDVSFELHTVRGVPCTLVEPRPRKLNRLQHKWLKKRRQRENKAEAGAGAGAGGAPGGQQQKREKKHEEEKDDDDDDDEERSAAAAGRTPPPPTPCVRRDNPASLEASGVLCAQVQTEFTPENWHLFADCSVVAWGHRFHSRT